MKTEKEIFEHLTKIHNYLIERQKEISLKNIMLHSLHVFKVSLITYVEDINNYLEI